MEDIEKPCYVIGPRDVTYEDDWCYGRSEVVCRSRSYDEDRAAIMNHLRREPERNGVPVYMLSDHGNLCRVRGAFRRRIKNQEGTV